MRWFSLALFLLVGVALEWVGWLVWKKQKISVLHEYHRRHVSPEDVPAYSRATGKALFLLGGGLQAAGLINFLTRSGWGWICGVGCFIWSVGWMLKTQKKYNGSVL